jgi:hypothetical protein
VVTGGLRLRHVARACAHSDRGGWGLTGGPLESNGFESDSNFNGFNSFQNFANFERSKKDLPWLQKFKIKYGFEGCGERNNFLDIYFYIFEVDCE